MRFNRVRFKFDEFGKGQVWIDDVRLVATLSITMEAKNNEPTRVTIELMAEVEGEVKAAESPTETGQRIIVTEQSS